MSIRSTSTYGAIIPGSQYISSLVRQGTISKEATKRLRWMDNYGRYHNARLTFRYYGISPQTFYRWKSRYDSYDLRTLELGSHRPYKVRGNGKQKSHFEGTSVRFKKTLQKWK